MAFVPQRQPVQKLTPIRYSMRTSARLASIVVLAAATTFGTLALAGAADAATAPISLGVCVKPHSRPKIIVLAVDGSGAVTGYSHGGHVGYQTGPKADLHWTTWTSSEGVTNGYLWMDDGYPSVGGGTFYAVPTRVRVWRPVDGIFTRLTITPHGSGSFHPNRYWKNPKAVTYRAEACSGGMWNW